MTKRTLSEIWIYPVKSLGGIPLKTSAVRKKGLLYDRRWMLVDEQNTFMTQRIHPRMALIKVTLSDTLNFHFEQETKKVSLSAVGIQITATIWDDQVEVLIVEGPHNEWLSEILGFRCRLASFPEENARAVDERYRLGDDHVSLADAYPLMVLGQSSLEDLNKRLSEPVPMNRFRPNLVFTGGNPYEEDGWKNFAVGKNRFVGVKPCARCVLTTVDQETAIQGKEPLKTLSRYRRQGEKVLFGQNVIPLDYDQITVGDEIVVG